MRLILFLFLFVWSFAAEAGCAYIGEITTEKFSIDISDGGCGPKVMITFWALKKNGSLGKQKEYPFNEECFLTLNGKDVRKIKKYDGYSMDGFSCRADGHTPLAGASYKLIQFGRSRNSCADDSELGSKYICVKGCGKSIVPEYINGHDGTC